jgi:GTP-binding protein
MFVDEINLTVLSGAGGSGSVSFKNSSSKSSPNGGSGGKGGSVKIKVNSNLHDLSHIISESSLKAENGTDGNKNFQNGKNGEDLEIEVPSGTQVFVKNNLYADLHELGSIYTVIDGSKSGKGNFELISKRNPNPQICEQGQKRQKLDIKLVYSIYSDLAIIGLPNAGKSTLISQLTNSKAKIGDYEFTTITPNLGILNNSDFKLKICDLPGLIKGASEGVGMGKKVLKHLRNTKIIVYLLDPLNDKYSLDEQINLLFHEIEVFDKNLCKIPVVKVVNKSDSINQDNENYKYISALKGEGLNNLIKNIEEVYLEGSERIFEDFQKITIKSDDLNISYEENKFICTGSVVEYIIGLSGSGEEVNNEIFYRYEKSILPQKLQDQGIQNSDTVVLGNLEFEYKK